MRTLVALVYLIIFWVLVKYKKVFINGLKYMWHSKSLLPFVLLLSAATIVVNSLRIYFLSKSIGKKIGVLEAVKIYLAGLGALLSSIKFGDSIEIFLLKKRGLRFYQGLVVYSIQRLLDLIFFAIFSAIFLGRRSAILTILLLLSLFYLLIKKRKAVFSLIRRYRATEKLEEEIEDALEGIKEIKSVRTIVIVFILTFFSILFQAFSIFLLSKAPILACLEAIFVIGNGSAIISPVPLGIGIWEIAAGGFLARYVAAEVAISSAITYRVLFIYIPAIFGAILLPFM